MKIPILSTLMIALILGITVAGVPTITCIFFCPRSSADRSLPASPDDPPPRPALPLAVPRALGGCAPPHMPASDWYVPASLAEDADLPPSWAGMPLRGIRANLDLAVEVIPQIREAGASVVGQLSTTMIFGNHEENLGLFGATWSQLWADDLLGAAPTADLAALVQRHPDGSLKWRTIEGRPYRTYRGCMCNPQWLEVLQAMVRKGIELGLDGFNATHHYESYCHCDYCREHARAELQSRLTDEERVTLFGVADMQEVVNPFAAAVRRPLSMARCIKI